LQGQTQLAFTLGLLFGQNVIEMGLGSLEAALPRPAEALCRAPVGFHLRHFVYSIYWPCYEQYLLPLQAGISFRRLRLSRYSLFLRCDYHDHLPAFHLRHLFNNTYFIEVLADPLQEFGT
jgi:hypothetical protein